MSFFYLVRHGETDWNREEVFRGRIDVPLNDRGRQQAQAAGRRLAAAGLAAVCTSPLGRARETAEIIARACGREASVIEAFVDMDFGDWQGLRLTEVERRFPELYQTWRTAPAEARIPGAESLVEVKERAVAAITALAGRFPEARPRRLVPKASGPLRVPASPTRAGSPKGSPAALCVVTHRVVSKLVMAWALGLDEAAFWRIRQDTACLNVFEYDGRELVVHLLNDTCHLSALAEGRKQADF
jgi:broad specificity phosphatase PhoE